MIVQAIYNYYQVLLNDPTVTIALPGYSSENISYILNLSKDGELLDVITLTNKLVKGKKVQDVNYQTMRVPERVKRSGTDPKPNFLWDNSAFVLGIPEQKGKDVEYGKRRFEAFRQHNLAILSRTDSENARSVIAFLEKHDPQKAAQHTAISHYAEEFLKGGNMTFQIEGKYIFNDLEVVRTWEEYLIQRDQSAVRLQCLVTGKEAPIARTHPDIKGIPGTRQNRAPLVSFNQDSFASYGRTQAFNSPISQRVASGYSVVLDYLLSAQNPNRPIYLGDTAVVFWAESPDKRYLSTFAAIINPAYMDEDEELQDMQEGRRKAEKKLGAVAQEIEKGKPLEIQGVTEGLDPATRFHVLGLAPNALKNASRLTVRFFLTDPFGRIVERLMQHYEDLRIDKEYTSQPSYLSPYRILAECVSPKVTKRDDEVKKSWSLLGGAFMRSILTGAPYPEGLYTAILNRIRHDTDETTEKGKTRSVKINYIRAAYIKAHLIRKYRRQGNNPYQEALQMSLNESYTHPAYVLGRLFAELEKAQREAIGQNINATIKDRYFTSACASPAIVFPTLLRLSHHWTTKAEYGGIADRKIQDLLNMLNARPFPSRLTLDEQGVFVLGYYHQRAAFYAKKGDNNQESTQSSESAS